MDGPKAQRSLAELVQAWKDIAEACRKRSLMADEARRLMGLTVGPECRVEDDIRAGILEAVAAQVEPLLTGTAAPTGCDQHLVLSVEDPQGRPVVGKPMMCSLPAGHEGPHKMTMSGRVGVERTDAELIWTRQPYLQKVP